MCFKVLNNLIGYKLWTSYKPVREIGAELASKRHFLLCNVCKNKMFVGGNWDFSSIFSKIEPYHNVI